MEPTTRVEDYRSEREMARGVERMSQEGWTIIGQSSFTPRKGCLRTVAGGFLFFNRKPVTRVTFGRSATA